MTNTTLRLTGDQHARLRAHLFPGDGNEAVAIALCGRRHGSSSHALCVHEVVPIPYDQCSIRRPDRVAWSTSEVVRHLERASKDSLAIVKFHSHPGGYDEFSSVDDGSDLDFFASVYGWMETDDLHASCVMLAGGRLFGRVVTVDGRFAPLDCIAVAGDDLHFWRRPTLGVTAPDFAERHSQLFGEETIHRLRQLAVAVVGCSGTGSPVVEMLARLGIGRLVLVDPDHVEEKNLNRILNATREDAVLRRRKVEVLGAAVARMGLGTSVSLVTANIATKAAVHAVADCDVAFGCVDGAFGRSVLNRIATFYNIPYFDLGVALQADGQGGVCEAMGAIHYIQPDRSSLRDRRVFTPQQVRAEGLCITDPAEYARQVRETYIKGVQVDRPAVITINFQIAAMAVNEFLARLHPYRYFDNAECAIVRASFIQGEYYRDADRLPLPATARFAGRGDVDPPLDLPTISNDKPSA